VCAGGGVTYYSVWGKREKVNKKKGGIFLKQGEQNKNQEDKTINKHRWNVGFSRRNFTNRPTWPLVTYLLSGGGAS
jgi:hypothetical protein